MITNDKPAACDAAGSAADAFSWQATHDRYGPPRRCEQAQWGPVRSAEMRVQFASRTYIIRYSIDDPNWRVRTLTSLDPLSDVAFALRKAPQTKAERAAFDCWAEAEKRRIWGDAP